MRTLFSLRTFIGLGAVALFAVVALGLFAVTSGGSGSGAAETRNIELIAVCLLYTSPSPRDS